MNETTKQGSYGSCEICRKRFTARGMTQHLKTCFARDIKDKKGTRTGSRFPVSVSSPVFPEYWLHYDISGAADLADLDIVVRAIWLECCSHLSEFRVEIPARYRGGRRQREEVDMGEELDALVKPGMQLHYEYDFGSTTELLVKVHARCEGPRRSEKIRLLARNEPISFDCSDCNAPASSLCTECWWDSDPFLCKRCGKSHDCGEEMLLPVVNSPRMGVCGYVG